MASDYLRMWHEARGRRRAEDRVGETYNRLTILRLVERYQTTWRAECRCSCGKLHVALLTNVVSGRTKSCGCLVVHRDPGDTHHNLKHGLSHTSEYATWRGMLARCENPRVRGYDRYGARGIRVCAGWHAFEAFFADLGEKPASQHTVDRIDNDGGYWCGRCDECTANGCPPNCRWATKTEQALNTCRTRWVVIDGKRVAAASLYAGGPVSRQLFWCRVRYGWDPRVAATTPPHERPRQADGTGAEVVRPPRRRPPHNDILAGRAEALMAEIAAITGQPSNDTTRKAG